MLWKEDKGVGALQVLPFLALLLAPRPGFAHGIYIDGAIITIVLAAYIAAAILPGLALSFFFMSGDLRARLWSFAAAAFVAGLLSLVFAAAFLGAGARGGNFTYFGIGLLICTNLAALFIAVFISRPRKGQVTCPPAEIVARAGNGIGFVIAGIAVVAAGFWLRGWFVSTTETAELTAKAERGDKLAQFELAYAYRYGMNARSKDAVQALLNLPSVPKDQKEAQKWYQKLAESGDGSAYNALGEMYERGEGMSTDFAEAARHYRAAVDLGYGPARFPLAEMYRAGRGVEKDVPAAIKLFRPFCEDQKELPPEREEACMHLGYIFEHGEGVAKDAVQAYTAYGHADTRRGKDALERLAKAMPPQQLGQARQLLYEATRNSPVPYGSRDYYDRAEDYYYGRSVPVDFAVAATWFHKAAKMGNAEAANYLGSMYMDGRGVKKDSAEAYFWWTVSIKRGKDDGSYGYAKRSMDNRRQAQAALTPEEIKHQEKRAEAWTPGPLPAEERK